VAPEVARELVVAADVAAAALDRFLSIRPRTIALAGGATPRALYERLATIAYPWAETEVFFGDERCVPADHPDSNVRMATEALLSKVAARVHPMPGETCDAPAYERELEDVFGREVPRFDLVLLGVGEDGHTASLFPGDPALNVVDRRVVRVERPDHVRLTLTLPVLSAAKVALFLVSGASKHDALARLMTNDNIPAARVRAGEVVVIADRDAAG
jgi:6-phosphogluconolactonase